MVPGANDTGDRKGETAASSTVPRVMITNPFAKDQKTVAGDRQPVAGRGKILLLHSSPAGHRLPATNYCSIYSCADSASSAAAKATPGASAGVSAAVSAGSGAASGADAAAAACSSVSPS